MFKRIALPIIALALVPTLGSAAPQPVAEPNGRLSGEVAGHAFDLPVVCSKQGPMLQIISHTDFYYTSNTSDGVEPVARAFFMMNTIGFTGYLGGKRYEFGSRQPEIDGFPFTYEGEITSKDHGDYPASFTIECPPQ